MARAAEPIFSEMAWKRYTDPALAPSIPMETKIETSCATFDYTDDNTGMLKHVVSKQPHWKITTSAWIREIDKIHTFELTFPTWYDAPPVVFRVTDPTPADREWLKNIGAVR